MFEQNWTLPEVCDICNGRFGRELDLHLTRDSLEAYLRLDLGLKPASAASKLREKRIKGTLRATGPLHGSRVRIEPTPNGDDMIPVPAAQVGFRRPGEEWVFLTERELSRERVASASAGSQVEVRVIAEAGGLERLRAKLADFGFSFAGTEQHLDIGIPEERIEVALDFLVDKTILRAASKLPLIMPRRCWEPRWSEGANLIESGSLLRRGPRRSRWCQPAKDRHLLEPKRGGHVCTRAEFVGCPNIGV